MEIEQESQKHLHQFSTEKAEDLKKALEPLLDNRPKPKFNLSWNEERHMWQSKSDLS